MKVIGTKERMCVSIMGTLETTNQSVCKNLWDSQSHTFSADMLKCTAIITMLIDHTGAGILEKLLYHSDIVFSENTVMLLKTIDGIMRLIGRMAFPIFCFLLVQGFLHTRSRIKYARNFLIFALISEIPFDFCFFGGIYLPYQNVFLTLFVGLLTLWGIETVEKSEINLVLKCILYVLVAVVGMKVSNFIHSDYYWIGVLLVLYLYIFRNNFILQCTIPFIVFLLSLAVDDVGFSAALTQRIFHYFESDWTVFISAFMIYRCNGKRYMKGGKYFFYAFYPVHIAILYVIRQVLVQVL